MTLLTTNRSAVVHWKSSFLPRPSMFDFHDEQSVCAAKQFHVDD